MDVASAYAPSAPAMNAKISRQVESAVCLVGENEMNAGHPWPRWSQQNNIPLGEFLARAKDRVAKRAPEL
jgi:hypothetical protein